MTSKTPNKPTKRRNSLNISLYPLSPEEALSAFFKIDPKKLKKSTKLAGKRRKTLYDRAK